MRGGVLSRRAQVAAQQAQRRRRLTGCDEIILDHSTRRESAATQEVHSELIPWGIVTENWRRRPRPALYSAAGTRAPITSARQTPAKCTRAPAKFMRAPGACARALIVEYEPESGICMAGAGAGWHASPPPCAKTHVSRRPLSLFRRQFYKGIEEGCRVNLPWHCSRVNLL